MRANATKKNANRHDMHVRTVNRDIGEPSLVRAASSENPPYHHLPAIPKTVQTQSIEDFKPFDPSRRDSSSSLFAGIFPVGLRPVLLVVSITPPAGPDPSPVRVKLGSRCLGPGPGIYPCVEYSAYLSRLWRADERARIADLLITSERSSRQSVTRASSALFRLLPIPTGRGHPRPAGRGI